ncbi:MAG: hypothetical protein ACRCST_06905 [Turicibacter sp.]
MDIQKNLSWYMLIMVFVFSVRYFKRYPINRKVISISLVLLFSLPFLWPGNSVIWDEGAFYYFGIPISFLTVSQPHETSWWLVANIVNGIADISVDFKMLVLNYMIIFLVLSELIRR